MHRRHRRQHDYEDKDYSQEFKAEYKKQRSRQKQKAKEGYGINLYRNTKNKMVGGVCSGIGDHFGIDHSIMRVIFVIAFFVTSFVPMAIGYFIACTLISPRPNDSKDNIEVKVEYDEKIRDYRPKTVFSKKESSKVRIDRTRMRIRKAKRRIEEMEKYVTSNKFKMEQEFSDLK